MIKMYSGITPKSAYQKGNALTRRLKAKYFATRKLDMAPAGAPKLPLLTRIKKFFTGLVNANKDYFTK